MLEKLTGYRTILFALAQFLVSAGLITEVEANALVEGVLALASLGLLVGTVYFRLKANKK